MAVSVLPFIIGGLEAFVVVFLSLGFAMAIAVKELTSKNHYLFFHNNGISRLQLWIFGFIFNATALLFVLIIIGLIRVFWKSTS